MIPIHHPSAQVALVLLSSWLQQNGPAQQKHAAGCVRYPLLGEASPNDNRASVGAIFCVCRMFYSYCVSCQLEAEINAIYDLVVALKNGALIFSLI